MKILLSSPHMSDEGYEKQYVKHAFDTNWIAPLGENVNGFEKDMEEYMGGRHAVALSSGTAGIHLALKLMGVGEGDIVFCQSLTFSGTCNPITYCGAKPVYIDSEPTSGNMSPIALEKAYKVYPNAKAVIIVDLYGTPANYAKLIPIIRKHGSKIIEDAAEALGASYNGKKLGLYGDVAILSFNGNKIITTSGGGMLLANTKEEKDKVVFWSTQSREKAPWYEHKEIGYNYRMSNVLAGIGRGQIKVLDKRVEQKNAIYQAYRQVFSGCDYIEMFGEQEGGVSSRWLSVIRLKNTRLKPLDVVKMLAEHEIEARPSWKPMHLQPVFADCDFFSELEQSSTSEEIFNTTVNLPSDTKTSLDDITKIAKLVREYVEKNS